MNKFFCAFLLFGVILNAQIDESECIIVDDNQLIPLSNGLVNTINGRSFTPKGDLRALVIYVDIEEEFLNEDDHQFSTWPIGEPFPIHNNQSVVNTDGSVIWAHSDETGFLSDIEQADTDDLLNISEFFYHMSNGQFKFYVETLMHPVLDTPIPIKIDPTGISNRSDFLNKVMNKINEIYPLNYDWSKFDNRINKSNFSLNNEASFSDNLSDNIIDYVYIIFRHDLNWDSHPINPTPNNFSKAVATIGGLAGKPIGGPGGNYSFGASNSGFLYLNYQLRLPTRIELTLHEMAHTFMGMPHVNMANGAIGPYFHLNYSWGIMDSYRGFMPLANAFERWVNGWIEIDYDINADNYNPNQTYRLKDYLGDSSTIRVKLPHVGDQYLWFENHLNENMPFYRRPFSFTNDALGNPIPQPNTGLYAFIEKITNHRSNTFFPANSPNGIKALHGLGNHDYIDTFDDHNPNYAWGSFILRLNSGDPNPYSDQNPTSMFWRDGLNEHQIDGELKLSRHYNGQGGLSNLEAKSIIEIDNEVVWGPLGNEMNLTNNKISAFTNPPIANLKRNSGENESSMEPTLFHGLSISFNYLSNGEIDLIIDYNDGIIENDFRATGNILIPEDEYITIDNSINLTINNTKTPNTRYADDNYSFNLPSLVIAENYSSFSLNSYSTLKLEENSTMIFDEYSNLTFSPNSKIIISSGSLLCIKENVSILNEDNLPKIIINDGFYQGPEDLVINNSNEYGLPTIFNVEDFCNSSNGYLHDDNDVILPNLNSCSQINTEALDSFKVTSATNIILDGVIDIKEGSFFDAYITKLPLNDCESEFYIRNSFYENTPINIPRNSLMKRKFNEKGIVDEVIIHPNPVNKGILNLEINKVFLADEIKYSIHSITGHLLDTSIIKNKSYSKNLIINVDYLKKGIYLIKIESNNIITTRKFLVE